MHSILLGCVTLGAMPFKQYSSSPFALDQFVGFRTSCVRFVVMVGFAGFRTSNVRILSIGCFAHVRYCISLVL